MSMITEQVKRLRTLADIAKDVADNSTDTVKTLREAADTIEQLAAKVREADKHIKGYSNNYPLLYDLEVIFSNNKEWITLRDNRDNSITVEIKSLIKLFGYGKTIGDMIELVFRISLEDFKRTWGGGEITESIWDSPYNYI